MSWWAETPQASLSQGDVISDVPLGVITHPLTQLSKQTLKGASEAWMPSSNWTPGADGIGHMLGRGRVINVLVLTESCQLDKRETKERVQVAPIYSVKELTEDARSRLWAQQRRSKMPLPECPTLGDSYADFRAIGSIDRKALDTSRRIAQLSEEGIARLQAQLLSFWTRRDPKKLFEALRAVAADGDDEAD